MEAEGGRRNADAEHADAEHADAEHANAEYAEHTEHADAEHANTEYANAEYPNSKRTILGNPGRRYATGRYRNRSGGAACALYQQQVL
jgi:uncharacterized protein YjbI with pentapeptide repeats